MKISNLLLRHVKRFDEIPSLKSVPILGHGYLFLPGGRYRTEKLTEAVEDMHRELGPVFRLRLGGMDIVVTLDADHTREMYRNEGKFPVRPPFPALIKYRQQAFNSVGVVPGNGPEWHHFRSGINPLLNTRILESYKENISKVARKFVAYVNDTKNSGEVLGDVFSHFLLFTIQAISLISPGKEFDCLSRKGTNASREIVDCSVKFMDGLYATLIGPPLWKYFNTSSYQMLKSSHDKIHGIISKQLAVQKSIFLKDEQKFAENNPFVHALFANPQLGDGDCIMLAVETFLGGIDATATTLSFASWFLAKDLAVQRKARNDRSDKYLKMVLKETLRMRMTAGANSRFVVNDMVMDDYHIPKNTLVMSFGSAISMLDRYFKNPLEFVPERWIKDDALNKGRVHPFGSLPFGHGPRMCPGRRVAEFEIVTLLRHLLDSYQLSTDSADVGMVYRMNRIPEKPLNVRFESLL